MRPALAADRFLLPALAARGRLTRSTGLPRSVCRAFPETGAHGDSIYQAAELTEDRERITRGNLNATLREEAQSAAAAVDELQRIEQDSVGTQLRRKRISTSPSEMLDGMTFRRLSINHGPTI